MIQQRVGDLLEIEEEGSYFYVVVLTKIAMFGGNIVFAFHNDGEFREPEELKPNSPGLNICTDLLLPKRENRVRRLARIEDCSPFWRTKLAKASSPFLAPGVKAPEWYIYDLDNLRAKEITRVSRLSRKQKAAMDKSCVSFDLVAKRVLDRYTPDQNPRI